jgi:hypothetical protein
VALQGNSIQLLLRAHGNEEQMIRERSLDDFVSRISRREDKVPSQAFLEVVQNYSSQMGFIASELAGLTKLFLGQPIDPEQTKQVCNLYLRLATLCEGLATLPPSNLREAFHGVVLTQGKLFLKAAKLLRRSLLPATTCDDAFRRFCLKLQQVAGKEEKEMD